MDKYSAYENIELPLLHTKKSRSERKKLIIEAARKLNVEDQLNEKPKQMSGGQQQRIALARALVSGADIILADVNWCKEYRCV
jgi:putative ABC transport system ATP-binding protein